MTTCAQCGFTDGPVARPDAAHEAVRHVADLARVLESP
jgi:hypothetical protein